MVDREQLLFDYITDLSSALLGSFLGLAITVGIWENTKAAIVCQSVAVAGLFLYRHIKFIWEWYK